jgi:uncharacterized protein (TIGR02996 family)
VADSIPLTFPEGSRLSFRNDPRKEAQRAAFLRGVLEEPGADVHRMAFADWLADQGEESQAGDIRRGLEDFPGERAFSSPPCRLAFGLEEARQARGFIYHIFLPLAAFMEHAEALFSAHPVTEVRLRDKRPAAEGRPAEYHWLARSPFDSPHCLRAAAEDIPNALFNRLAGGRASTAWLGTDWQNSVRAAAWPTAAEALAALSRACVAFGRAQAGLPPLP